MIGVSRRLLESTDPEEQQVATGDGLPRLRVIERVLGARASRTQGVAS
jgi:hypothetical protein